MFSSVPIYTVNIQADPQPIKWQSKSCNLISDSFKLVCRVLTINKALVDLVGTNLGEFEPIRSQNFANTVTWLVKYQFDLC